MQSHARGLHRRRTVANLFDRSLGLSLCEMTNNEWFEWVRKFRSEGLEIQAT
jgi:hypothetical protein